MESRSSMFKTTSYLVESMAPAVGATVERPLSPGVEALRLCSAASLAVYYFFLPWIDALFFDAPARAGIFGLGNSSFALFLIGLISQLGTFSNHVFFMVAGFTHLPTMVADSVEPGYWRRQYKSVVRRVLATLCIVVFYAAITAGVNLLLNLPEITPANPGWLFGGFGFVWMYIALIVLAPVFAWAQKRWHSWPFILTAVFFIVEAANCMAAFFTGNSAHLQFFDWRRLSGGATFVIGYLLMGFAAVHWESFHRLGGSVLFSGIFMTFILEASLASTKDADLLGAVCFGSTSIVAFLLAAGAVILVMSRTPTLVLAPDEPRKVRLLRWLASSVIGLYCAQAILRPLWSVLSVPLLGSILGLGPTDVSYGVLVALLFVLVGIGTALILGLCFLAIDRVVRQPFFRFLRLA